MAHRFNIKKKLLFLLIIISVFYSCRSTLNYEYIEHKEIPREAVNIAIKDYGKRLRMRRDTSIVAVNIIITYTSTDWFTVTMLPYEGDDDKFPMYIVEEYMEQIPLSWIPTECVEENNILYVWHNPSLVLTKDFVKKLATYNLILGENEDWIVTSGGSHVNYIFCKYNYKKRYYRRVETHYLTPLPDCKCH